MPTATQELEDAGAAADDAVDAVFELKPRILRGDNALEQYFHPGRRNRVSAGGRALSLRDP